RDAGARAGAGHARDERHRPRAPHARAAGLRRPLRCASRDRQLHPGRRRDARHGRCRHDPMSATRTAATGTVYLVGAGPGAPDLLTLRAARLLAEADVVLHDALVHPETLALAARAERIAVGKRCGRHSSAQIFINKRLVDAARRHRVVVRLKGGDPMLFGRAQEEIAALEKAGIEYEVVPGVTAALAAASDLRISLTQRGAARSVAFVTPRVAEGEAPSEWARTVAAADTAVIYMGAGDAVRVRDALLEAGVAREMPIALV